MNGRIYDPLLGRFLSGDVWVQFPGDLQSYNRFSYVGNNPLSYTDPSGYSQEDDDVVELPEYKVSAKRLKGDGYRDGGNIRLTNPQIGDMFRSGGRVFRIGLDLDSNSIVAVQQSWVPQQQPSSGAAAPSVSAPSIEPPQLDPSDAAEIASDAVAAAAAEAAGEASTPPPEDPPQSLGRTIAGFVPVLGSTLDGIDAFKKGNYWTAAMHFGLAALDLTGGSALAKGVIAGGFKLRHAPKLWKAYFKAGVKGSGWRGMQKRLVRGGVLPKQTRQAANLRSGLTVDHVFVRQGREMSHWVTNLPMNLNPGVSRSLNSSMTGMNLFEVARHGPEWAQVASILPVSTAVGWGFDSGDPSENE